ncbi:uncharacterized protein LOC142530218 [Primulina tabacum]|uniref:uncharacterized protein LOC142530218 n=1 Tax=Primulina tabacum TaxID=48773 RepID=UPI003F593C54
MSDLRRNGSVPTLPLPRPKSPPKYPDLYGKRRELAKIQILERDIGFLQEELKAVEGLPPASRSCKEVADFVAGNADPLIPTTKKISRSRRFWKWLCGGLSCFSISWIFCCCQYCVCDLEMPHCPECNTCRCRNTCLSCRIPNCQCFSCWNSRCFDDCSTCRLPRCCIPEFTSCLSWPSCFSCLSWPSCLTCSCSCASPCSIPCSCPSIQCRFPKCLKVKYPKCLEVNVCSYCDKNCCYPCYFCY